MGNTLHKRRNIQEKEEDLNYIFNNTNFNKEAIEKWHREFIQDFPNGRMVLDQFIQMYKVFYPEKENIAEFCSHIFRSFDEDNSGYLDFRNFMLAIDVTSNGNVEDKLRWSFRVYDIDKDGEIDLNEMTSVLSSIVRNNSNENLKAETEEIAKKTFDKLDLNHDGVITEKEFLKACDSDKELSRLMIPNMANNNEQ